MKQAFLLLLLLLAAPLRAQELIMFEERGCFWCARWNEEIAPIYPKTAEAKIAPLRRVDLHAPRPNDLAGIGAVTFSPTFVLFHEGAEIGRIEGYPGEAFFWGLLGQMLKNMKEGSS